jgi:hypothetical protein
LLWALLNQIIWCAILLAVAHLALNQGVRHLVIQGG